MAKINRFEDFDKNESNEGNEQAVAVNDFVFVRFGAKTVNPGVSNMIRKIASPLSRPFLLCPGTNGIAITEFKTTLSKAEAEAKFNSIPNIKFVIIDRGEYETLTATTAPRTAHTAAATPANADSPDILKVKLRNKKSALAIAIGNEDYAAATKLRDEIAAIRAKLNPPAPEAGNATAPPQE